ncbi:hypothetical protein GDO81_023764 [Engystomops pustulosus]|uniref:Uncharacterized protein n=1 Tax=Engystomops pustulosus TaxID=76066 RepID=A0AAV6ZQF8_ENGPU|nr:hypothetical protein GDO81_023764 [Engystomops pustulosus]
MAAWALNPKNFHFGSTHHFYLSIGGRMTRSRLLFHRSFLIYTILLYLQIIVQTHDKCHKIYLMSALHEYYNIYVLVIYSTSCDLQSRRVH